jgi:hypothetical protein
LIAEEAMRRSFPTETQVGVRCHGLRWLLLIGLALALPAQARAEEKVIRLGIIGLDTSHVTAFTSYLNNPKNNTGCKVAAAFPGGSPDFKASADRLGWQ